ncbi:MAG: hypothetical protein KDE27_19000 [Planctomycetes bacterium]|nr:hypothetical protein [Planctomycetota bacterium]
MLESRFRGALCALSLSAAAMAQTLVDGTMTFYVAGGNWIFQGCTESAEIDDPIGMIQVNGTLINTRAEADGDTCSGNGIARDTVAGGPRLLQTAHAEGSHVCRWLYFGLVGTSGEVEIYQTASIDGSVTLQNKQAIAAALGFCEASSSAGTLATAVLTDSVAETAFNTIGNLSNAYCGEPYTPNVGLGAGTYPDSDFDTSGAVVCTGALTTTHRSCAFIRVGALRTAASAGNAEGTATLSGICTTQALLYVCPE